MATNKTVQEKRNHCLSVAKSPKGNKLKHGDKEKNEKK